MYRFTLIFLMVIFVVQFSNKLISATLEGSFPAADLVGEVTDARGTPLQRVAVFIPELKMGTYSDSTGNYEMGGNLMGGHIYSTLAVTNLLGEVYYDHLSRIKPGSFNDPDVGFNNMGRNFTLSLHVPLYGHN
jgi:hypothetical protein